MRSAFILFWLFLVASLVLTPVHATADNFDDGMQAARVGDYQTAVQLWLPLAKQGDAAAQTGLGGLYINGWGVPQNEAEGVRYYRLAAEQANPRAQFYLGDLTETGRAVPKNLKEAVRLYQLSALQGFVRSQHRLGEMYRDGIGVEKNLVSAHMWFSLAIANDEEQDRGGGLEWLEMAMDTKEIQEARTRASKCLESKYEDCGEIGNLKPVSTSRSFAQDFADKLYGSKIEGAIALAQAQLLGQSDDQQAAFALGSAQFLKAVESLGQGLYRYGLKSELDTSFQGLSGLPFLRLPIPQNPQPEQVTYDGLRGLLDQFVNDLAVAEATLAAIGPEEFDMPLDLAQVRLDFDGDGEGSAQEGILFSFAAVSSRARSRDGYLVDFDQSDAPWLQGYCHLLSAMAEFPLAHDWQADFNQTFHNLFPQTDLPSSELVREFSEGLAAMERFRDENGNLPSYPKKPTDMTWDEWRNDPVYKEWKSYSDLEDSLWIGQIADLIAFIHLFNWPVVEPERMGNVRVHLLEMIALSRENWRRIQTETDNMREWVPAPNQTGIFGGLAVTDQTVRNWHAFLDEFEAILEGHRLIKHWRFVRRGVNVRRMLEEPRTFDPVLIAQGSAVLPYLEEGDLVTGDTAETMLDIFEGGFSAYFIWFN